MERIVNIVKSRETGRAGKTLIITIPKEVRDELKIGNGTKFYVKVDDDGRIIYEPLK